MTRGGVSSEAQKGAYAPPRVNRWLPRLPTDHRDPAGERVHQIRIRHVRKLAQPAYGAVWVGGGRALELV